MKYFVNIARGSCARIKYQLQLSKELFYFDEEVYHHLYEDQMKGYC
ncbi:four helix bundle protein [candidate division KSB1 bacterium]|nr:four helix bundle protein [candidate division KSB1 bacterium]